MRILFVTTHTFLPQRAGGSESSTHDLALALSKRGHAVAVYAMLGPGDSVWVMNRLRAKLGRRRVPSDRRDSYRVYRGYDLVDNLGEVLGDFRPDVVVAQAGRTLPLLNRAREAGCRTVLYLRDVEFDLLGDHGRIGELSLVIANSAHVGAKFEQRFGMPCVVIPPLIDPDRYRTATTATHCTFINPAPQKGVDIALALARMNPDIPFQFVEGWPLPEAVQQSLRDALATLPNVVFRPRTGNMRTVYGTTRVLLVPSLCEEAWGRVVTEAQFSGIPVVASDIGGLPESVGNGGVLIGPDAGIDVWSGRLREVFCSAERHAQLSELARRRAHAEDISVASLLTRVEGALVDALA